jgi:hypothetical protein
MIEKKVELINKGATETVTKQQELRTEVLNADSVRPLDDRRLGQHKDVRRRHKFQKWTQGNGVSRKEKIAVHTRVIRRAVPVVRKGNECSARRIPQRRMRPEFNMGRDNRVARKQLQPKTEGTSDKFIRKLLKIKDEDLKEQLHSRTKKIFGRLGKKTVALQMVREIRIVGSSIGLQEVGDWTFWKVRQPPKRKKAQKTSGEPESMEPLLHSETLTV